MSKKVLVVSEYASSYYHPFKRFGEQVNSSDLLWTKPDEIALVVFTGGADVSPALYGQEAARGTSTVPRRDIYESITFHKAKMLNKPMVGVCRGSQFLNIMAGGKLCQHLDGHFSWHKMMTCKGEEFDVSSTHHQMMLPPSDAKVIGWASKKHSKHYYGELSKLIDPEPEKEYEAVYFPNIRSIGVQYHPEMMHEYTRGFNFVSQIIEEYLGV